ncbi:hypothetical protein [Devosia sp.]|uniref:hypothetical protein n=1 Tax=Devosia sp. TaxID=1871048 RepID=UPI003F720EF4
MATRIATASFFLLIMSGVSLGCDVAFDPALTWQRMIDQSEVVFVGTVIETEPETQAGWGRVVFDVESWGKGGSGSRFEAGQGSGSNCVLEFPVGARVIFSGSPIIMGGPVLASDMGQDPTVFLNDPPTYEQSVQLNYVNKLAQEHAAKGATK